MRTRTSNDKARNPKVQGQGSRGLDNPKFFGISVPTIVSQDRCEINPPQVQRTTRHLSILPNNQTLTVSNNSLTFHHHPVHHNMGNPPILELVTRSCYVWKSTKIFVHRTMIKYLNNDYVWTPTLVL